MARGMSLNNPGNLRKSKTAWKGKVASSDSSFEEFDTPDSGLRAMMKNLANYQKLHGDETLNDVISRYAPSSENDTPDYIKFIADQTGIDPNAKIDLSNPTTAIPIAKAMVQREQGKDSLLPDGMYQKAFADAVPTPTDAIAATSNQEISDPIGAGRYLAEKFTRDTVPPVAGSQTADSGQIQTDAMPDDHLDLFKQAKLAPPTAMPTTKDQTDLLAVGGTPPAAAKSNGSGVQQNLDALPPPEKGAFRTAVDQFNQGTTAGWADEIIDPIAAGYGAMTGAGNFGDLYKDARAMSAQDLAAQHEAHPYISGAANLAGALTGGVAAGGVAGAIAPESAAKLAAITKANPWKTAGAIGGGWNSLSAAGNSQGDAGDRAIAAGRNFLPGVVGGLAGYGLLKGALGAVTSPTAQTFMRDESSGGGGLAAARAAQVADPIGAGAAAPAAAGVDSIGGPMLDQQDLANLSQGKVLPLTAGDRMQDVATQRMEQIAMKEGSKPMLAALNEQQMAAQKPFINALGGQQILDTPNLGLRTQTEVENAANILRKQYDSLGGQVTAAYKAARELGEGVGISSDAVQKGFLDTVNTNLAERSYQPGDVPMLDEKLADLSKIMAPAEDGSTNVTSVKLKQLEQWKQRFNQGNFSSDQISEPTVNMHVKMVGRAYDDFLTNLADTSIVNGDQEAITAFKTARGLAAQKFKFYDSDSTVQRILDTRELSGENLVNVVLGAGKISGKGDNGQLVGRMIELAGDRAPEMQDALKRGMLSKIMNDSLSQTKNPSSTDAAANLISFQNMKKSLGNLMQQKEAFGAVFDDTERGYFQQMYDDLGKIASKQSGAVNNSSTGAYMADYMQKVGKFLDNPIFRYPALGTTKFLKMGMEHLAASHITGKAEKGLDEFIAQAIKNVDAPAVYYGSVGGSSAVDSIANIMKQQQQAGAAK